MRKSLLLLSLAASTAGAQVRIGTFAPPTPPSFGGTAVGPFGIVRVGQAFFAPAGATTLTSLSYWMDVLPGIFGGGGPATLSIYNFAGGPPTGAALFTQSFNFPTTAGGANLVSFAPNVAVTGGGRYIALVGTSVNSSADEALLSELADSPNNTTGDLIYRCITGNATCDNFHPGHAAVFEANFTVAAVPEPATLTLGGTGLVVLGLLRRRRRA